jgi:SET domain-containing protein
VLPAPQLVPLVQKPRHIEPSRTDATYLEYIAKGLSVALEVVDHKDERGYGVVARQDIQRYDYICAYTGRFLKNADEIEAAYARAEARGELSYYIAEVPMSDGTVVAVDARNDAGFGGLFNHAGTFGAGMNAALIAFTPPNSDPKLAFMAKKDIPSGTEILWRYGPRPTDPEIQAAHPWYT